MEQPRVSASSGAPLVSWSASEDESPSDRTVLQRRKERLGQGRAELLTSGATVGSQM